MSVPFLDLRASYLELKPEIDDAIARVLDSGCYILGPEVEAFEAEWASYCGASDAVGVGNGLDALILALRALDIGPGDEVIVPSNTYIATWLAVSAVGATPVPVEPDPDTYNINPSLIPDAITHRTKVLLPVHLYGQPADLDPILSIARNYSLAVVEDAAQSHGARYKDQRIGAHGDVVCWSFYPGKNLGGFGDGGAITTNRSDIADQVRSLRNYGSRKKYIHEIKGYNSRLDSIQAAILRVKLKLLDSWNKRRADIALYYTEALLHSDYQIPLPKGYSDPSWHLYVVRHPNRNSVQDKLNMAGVNTIIHYPIPPHAQNAYSDLHLPVLSNTTLCTRDILSLPIGPHLTTEQAGLVVCNLLSA